MTIPAGAVDCGADSQVGPADEWTYAASTCVHDEVENGAEAWMITEFTDPNGEVGKAVLVMTSDDSLRRYAETADGTVLQDDLCATVEWADAGENQFALSGSECGPAG